MADRYDEDLFLGYIEGDLTPEQTREFEKLLVEDARLRNLVAQLVLDRNRLRNLPREQAPPELIEQVNQHLERHMLLDGSAGETGLATPARRFRINRYLAYGSLAALVALSATLMIQTLHNPGVTKLASTQKPAGQTSRQPLAAAPPSPADSAAPSADLSSAEPSRQLADLEKKKDDIALPRGDRRESAPLGIQDHAAADEGRLPLPAPTAAPAAPTDQKIAGGTEDAGDLAPAAAPAAKALAGRTAPARSIRGGEEPPLPIQGPPGNVVDTPGLRLEITSASPAASQQLLLAWASRNNAPVHTAEGEVLSAKQLDLENRPKEIDQLRDEPAAPREVFVIVTARQIPLLLAYLKDQRGQDATLTQTLGLPQKTLAARADKDEILEYTRPKESRDGAASQPAPPLEKTETAANAAEQKPAQAQEQRYKVAPESLVPPTAPETPMRIEVLFQEAPAQR